jgi:hypothetical protein
VSEKAPRKKKEKKERVGPKRAMSAYFFFLADQRVIIREETPDIKVKIIQISILYRR